MVAFHTWRVEAGIGSLTLRLRGHPVCSGEGAGAGMWTPLPHLCLLPAQEPGVCPSGDVLEVWNLESKVPERRGAI